MVSIVSLNRQTDLSKYHLFFDSLESPHTEKAYKLDLEQFYTFLQKHHRITLEEAEEKHFTSFVTFLRTNKAKDRTISRKIAFLKKFYPWLLRQQLIYQNPTMWLKGPTIPIETVETREIPEEKVRELFLKLRPVDYTTAMHRALMTVLLYTGMRVGEALSLKLNSIYKCGVNWVVEWKAKKKKKLTLPLHPVAMQAIRDLVTQAQAIGFSTVGESYLFRPTPTKGERKENAIGPCQALKIFKGYFAAIGVDGVSPHSARVTVISQLVAQGVALQDVADAVGHSSIIMTRAYAKRKKGMGDSPVLGIRY